MLTKEQVSQFQTLGFVLCKTLFSPDEMASISKAFDAAMRLARGGTASPELVRDERGYSMKRQQEVPFLDYDPDTFYPLLDDDRLMDAFEQLIGDDFIFTLSEGIIHAGGSDWHSDAVAPEGFFTMRAALYLDFLGPADGCLSVIPGSHNTAFREALRGTINDLGFTPKDIPGRYSIANEPGDVVFMNHKVYHASLSDNPGRRAIHINCSQYTTPELNRAHFEWLHRFLTNEPRRWGRFYSERLIETAGPRRKKMLDRAITLGFGDTGPIKHTMDT